MRARVMVMGVTAEKCVTPPDGCDDGSRDGGDGSHDAARVGGMDVTADMASTR